MTRKNRRPAGAVIKAGSGKRGAIPDHWALQDAKARFSELVRKARTEGPQHVTVHGREEVVVIAAREFRRLQGGATGKALLEVMRASPHKDLDLSVERLPAPVRPVDL